MKPVGSRITAFSLSEMTSSSSQDGHQLAFTSSCQYADVASAISSRVAGISDVMALCEVLRCRQAKARPQDGARCLNARRRRALNQRARSSTTVYALLLDDGRCSQSVLCMFVTIEMFNACGGGKRPNLVSVLVSEAGEVGLDSNPQMHRDKEHFPGMISLFFLSRLPRSRTARVTLKTKTDELRTDEHKDVGDVNAMIDFEIRSVMWRERLYLVPFRQLEHENFAAKKFQ